MSSFVNLLDIVYPVGAVVHTFSSTSPASTVGGTWESIETFLLGSSSAGETGGEEEHVLSLAEMPKHEHMGAQGSWFAYLGKSGSTGCAAYGISSGNWGYWNDASVQSNYRGSDAAHNNMPPYTTCFIWRRTA